jgi:hypothetical protein
MKRRDKVGREWLTGINLLVDFTIDDTPALTFNNAAVAAGVATPATGYRVQWFRFDNAPARSRRLERRSRPNVQPRSFRQIFFAMRASSAPRSPLTTRNTRSGNGQFVAISGDSGRAGSWSASNGCPIERSIRTALAAP